MTAERIGKRIAAMAAELQELLGETLIRCQAVVGHRLVAGLAEAPVAELGESSLAAALSTLLRISKNEAGRRVHEARDLGPRRAMSGEVLAPVLACTAAAQARGEIGAEHVRIIRRFFDQLPRFVPYDVREAAEAQLADIAGGLKPEELRVAADRLAMLLDQDGDLTDVHRARRRYLVLGKQQCDGMSELRGMLDPQARAVLEAVWAKLAAPGMCNPEDQAPCVDGRPSAEALAADVRSTGQRNHDALTAMGRALLASGRLGSHNGLPVTLVITTTLGELECGRGHAVTAGGSLLPMSQVIRQASAAHHCLAVFDNHTEEPLYLGAGQPADV